MAGIGGCRSSGAFTADKLIYTGSGKLTSIHALAVAPNEGYVKIYDGTSASGTVIGVYADVTHVAGTGTTFIIEFS